MSERSNSQIALTDQMGRKICAPPNPQRIVSLVPSQTELLFDLGLNEEIVGVTGFCIHPARGVEAKQRVGGTKRLELDTIESLQPDLIIGNKEENDRDQVLELAESYPVWMSDVLTLENAVDMIRSLGRLVNRAGDSDDLAARIERGFAELRPIAEPLRVAYFIWQKPLMVAGRDTFINEMLDRCGMVNAFAGAGDSRYPRVSADEILSAELDTILLSSEPFLFGAKHRAVFQEQFPSIQVHLVDGEMFSWYGSRLVQAVEYFGELIGALERRAGEQVGR